MKLTKKKVIIIALAVCLFATISYGTLAWFTDSDSVTNKFYVGDSTTDPDKVFGVDVWETVDGTEYGKDTKDTEGATYEDILPGQIFDKDPYVTNTGIHPQWVRAIVTVTGADILYDAMVPKGATVSEWEEVELLLPGTDANWTFQNALYTKDGEFVYVYYYNKPLEAGLTTEKLFDSVAIPTELTKEQAAELKNFNVTVLAQVIQSEHLADPANPGQMVATAQDAFKIYWDAPETVAGYTKDDLATNVISGDLGTPAETIVYNPADYSAPGSEGVMNLNGIKAYVADNDELILIPAEFSNSTLLLDGGANLTLGANSYIIKGEATPNVVYINTNATFTINGKVVGTDISYEDIEVYFVNCTLIPMPW